MDQKNLRILIVEDNADHLELVCSYLRYLRSYTAEILTAATFSEAVELVNREELDAIILDLNLPDSNQTSIFEFIAEYAPHVPLIVLTALNDIQLAIQAMQFGAQDYLSKEDLSPALLERTISYSIERKHFTVDLAQRNFELQQFAGRLAHEVKNPLYALDSLISAIRENSVEQVSRERSEESLQIVQNLIDLVEDMLSFARASTFEVEKKNVELNALVHEIVVELKHSQEKKFTVDVGNLPSIRGHAVQLRILFKNLLQNAIKYNRSDVPSVQLAAIQEGDRWIISVTDNGVGIPENDQERIFKLFQRAHGDTFSGTGIGLAYSRQIVQMHNGRIWVETSGNEGSTFHIEMPACLNDPDEAEDQQPAEAPVQLDDIANQSNPVRIVIADDYEPIRARLLEHLQSFDELSIVGEASNAEDAIKQVELTNADLLIADMNLGASSGVEVIKELRARNLPMPVIIISAEGNSLVETHLKRIGAFGFMRKDEIYSGRFLRLIHDAIVSTSD